VNVTVNGERVGLAEGSTLAELIEARLASARGVAAAVDGEVVPRAAWSAAVLRPGQRIELLTATPGG
jgi:sulfur carrier protein